MVWPLDTFHWLAEMKSGLALLRARQRRGQFGSTHAAGSSLRRQATHAERARRTGKGGLMGPHHCAVQSAAPASGRPQSVQPAQESPGSPQSRHASQNGSPSKLQNMPGGQVESALQ